LVEEEIVLTGDGTGQNLLGIIPQALPYSGSMYAVSQENALDRVLLAVVQMAMQNMDMPLATKATQCAQQPTNCQITQGQ
jgi:hypothetical protein